MSRWSIPCAMRSASRWRPEASRRSAGLVLLSAGLADGAKARIRRSSTARNKKLRGQAVAEGFVLAVRGLAGLGRCRLIDIAGRWLGCSCVTLPPKASASLPVPIGILLRLLASLGHGGGKSGQGPA